VKVVQNIENMALLNFMFIRSNALQKPIYRHLKPVSL